MAKIKDRLLLGAISGLGANIVKLGIMRLARQLKLAEFDGIETAAGVLLPPHKISVPKGKLIGFVGDATIAAMLGTATTYVLSITGKDNYLLKGASSGMLMWTTLYGALNGIGISKLGPASPKTVLSQFIAHTAFGAVSATLATRLGDPGLFTGELPLSASSIQPEAQKDQVGEYPFKMPEEPGIRNQEHIYH